MKTELISIPAYADSVIGDTVVEMSEQCLTCKHLNGDMVSCKAFPDGIPDIILIGGYNHEKLYPGDNDIRFEKQK